MQDTRGEPLTYEAPGRPPKARDNARSTILRTKVDAPEDRQRPPEASGGLGASKGLRRAIFT